MISLYILFSSDILLAQKITFKGENIPLQSALDAIRSQTDFTVFGQKKHLEQARRISINANTMELKDFLREICKYEPFNFTIEDKVIALSKIERSSVPYANKSSSLDQHTLLGQVLRKDNKKPLTNATVKIKGTSQSATTNSDGYFAITFKNENSPVTLLISYLGMKELELKGLFNQTDPIIALLEENQETIEDVVVTGIFTRSKESFSGASASYSAEQLKMVSGTNVLQSLNILDPSFKIVQNSQFGSDPNQALNIEIRGKTSVAGLEDAYGSNPNQPLFIMDGFETTMERIRDISMDRVGSITILKDATATSMYGSKGANGVVVLETIKPKPGKLGISYNLRSNIQVADLTDYNLMNAQEKLQFELLSGYYGGLDENGHINNNSQNNEDLYFQRLKEVARGVDSYWMNEPLRTGVSQSHDLGIFGGSESFQYNVGLTKTINQGVMDKSGNIITDGNVSITYRNGNFSFNNMLNVRAINSTNAPVAFSKFVQSNPYFRKYNEHGQVDKLFATAEENTGLYNPLYDYHNNNIDENDNQEIINNFNMDWAIMPGLNFRINLGITQTRNQYFRFRSPLNTEFISQSMEHRGAFREKNEKLSKFNSLATLTYGKNWNKQFLNLVAGASLNNSRTNYAQFDVEGFLDDKIINPSLAFNYASGALPSYLDLKRREAGFLLNTNYGYNNRYIFDGNIRLDGSSIYGTNKNTTAIWSVGGYWNISREGFMNKTKSWLESLRVRASYGNLGNQNFNDYISLQIYQYSKAASNPFGPGVIIDNFGNQNLRWQKTLNQNYGLDLVSQGDRLRFTLNHYIKNTDPLLVYITTPASSGRTQFIQNLGILETSGWEADINMSVIQNSNLSWRIAAIIANNRSEYKNIGNSLKEYNQTNRSKNLQRFYDGASPDDLWAVRSLGIDPASGREMFQKINDQETFVHDYADEVNLGSARAKYDGNLSTSLYYKGFQFFASFRYQLGGKAFMTTLFDKVENISSTAVINNQDKRALYDRWQNPGDIAYFKSIAQTNATPMSSRFIQDNDVFTLQSVSLIYETKDLKFLQRIKGKSLRFGINSNDLLYLSTIKNERGIDYPFARDITFNLGLSF